MFPGRVVFGRVGAHASATDYHVWGANAMNWNLREGQPIGGGGMAAVMGVQKKGVFGIVRIASTRTKTAAPCYFAHHGDAYVCVLAGDDSGGGPAWRTERQHAAAAGRWAAHRSPDNWPRRHPRRRRCELRCHVAQRLSGCPAEAKRAGRLLLGWRARSASRPWRGPRAPPRDGAAGSQSPRWHARSRARAAPGCGCTRVLRGDGLQGQGATAQEALHHAARAPPLPRRPAGEVRALRRTAQGGRSHLWQRREGLQLDDLPPSGRRGQLSDVGLVG